MVVECADNVWLIRVVTMFKRCTSSGVALVEFTLSATLVSNCACASSNALFLVWMVSKFTATVFGPVKTPRP